MKSIKKEIKVFRKKKSKFLGFSFYINNREEVKEIIKEEQKEYKDAQYIIYAYNFNNNILEEKFYNDKEAFKTIGKPILYFF